MFYAGGAILALWLPSVLEKHAQLQQQRLEVGICCA